MKNFLKLCSILIILLLHSCVKEPMISEPSGCDKFNKPMPEVTATGANTFGCKINGVSWVAYTDGFSSLLGGTKRLDNTYSEQFQHAYIVARKKIYESDCDTINQSFQLYINNAVEGENYFSQNSEYVDWITGCSYELDTTAYNKIYITKLDTESDILSCSFAFTAISRECQDTIVISNGRLDSRY